MLRGLMGRHVSSCYFAIRNAVTAGLSLSISHIGAPGPQLLSSTNVGAPIILSISDRLGPRGRWTDRAGGEGKLRGMDRSHASIGPPPGISSAEYSASVYPETREAGETPVGRALCSGPGAPEKRRSSTIGHL